MAESESSVSYASSSESEMDTLDFLDVDTNSNGSHLSSSEEIEEEDVYFHLQKYGASDAPTEPLDLARARLQAPRVRRYGMFEISMITEFDVMRWCALPSEQRAAALNELVRKSKAARQAEREAAAPRAQFSQVYKARVLWHEFKHVLTQLYSKQDPRLANISEYVKHMIRTQPMPTLLRSMAVQGVPFVAIVNINTHGRVRFRRTKRSVRTVTFEVPSGAIISRINFSPHSQTFSSPQDLQAMNEFLAGVTALMQAPPLDPTSDTLQLTRRVVDARVKRTRTALLSKHSEACASDKLETTLQLMRFLGQLSNLQAVTFLPTERVLDKQLVRTKTDVPRMTGVNYILPGAEPQLVFPSDLDAKPDTFRLSSVVAKLYRRHGVRHFVIVDWSCSNYGSGYLHLGEMNVSRGMTGGNAFAGGYATKNGNMGVEFMNRNTAIQRSNSGATSGATSTFSTCPCGCNESSSSG